MAHQEDLACKAVRGAVRFCCPLCLSTNTHRVLNNRMGVRMGGRRASLARFGPMPITHMVMGILTAVMHDLRLRKVSVLSQAPGVGPTHIVSWEGPMRGQDTANLPIASLSPPYHLPSSQMWSKHHLVLQRRWGHYPQPW